MDAPGYDDLEASRERFCPFCDEPLTHRTGTDDVGVDRCTVCGATWFDRNELRRSGLRTGLPTHSEMLLLGDISWKGRRVHCPRCDVRALRMGVAGGRGVAYCERCRGYLVQGGTDLEPEPRILQRLDHSRKGPVESARGGGVRRWILPAAGLAAIVLAVLALGWILGL